MCAQFGVKVKVEQFSVKHGIQVPEGLKAIDERFLPYKPAPAIVKLDNQDILKLAKMSFSLVPSWSKEPKVKFATHNARIETVIEKPTWRGPFEKFHCLVPITSFYESAYEGPLAGNILEFTEAQDELLFAAGIFDIWSDPNSDKKLYSFSILTTEPTKFILDHGHDRSPLFLDFEKAKQWLSLKKDSLKMVEFLLENNQKPDLKVQVDRPLKAGWEKRK